MLQQILRDMFIDPEILEELSDDQKQILFFKMREEQIRRWKANEDKFLAEEKLKPQVKEKDGKKHVKFHCDENSELIIDLIDQPDEIDMNDLKKKQEEEALKKAEEQARKEADLKRKELDEIEKKKKEEIKKKEEVEKLKKAKEEKEAEIRRKADEEAALKAVKVQKEKEATEKKLHDKKRKNDEEEKRRLEEQQREAEELHRKEEIEKKRQEEELAEEERKRKEEIYEKMKKEQEENRQHEEEERKSLEDDWKERELKAKAAEQLRRNSFSYSKNEFERMRKIAKEKTELEKMRKNDDIPIETMKIKSKTEKNEEIISSKNESPKVSHKNYKQAIKRPPLPTRPDALRPTISTPVNVTSTRDEVDMIPVQKEVVKPSRPPPAPSKGSPVLTQKETLKSKKSDKPNLPPRPKSKLEVLTWWKDVEYPKLSGLDEEKKPMEWFHGIITRHEAEKLLGNKKQGSYLVRVSERVWGYTISFKDIGRFKHFLIDTIHGGYQFFGMEQIIHNSLNELIEYHKKCPISGLGQEILLYPCGQEKSRPDYEHLFTDNTSV